MYIERILDKHFKKATKQFPVLLITGPRQVGKTTFLQHCCSSDRKYVSLDDPLICDLAKNDPSLFLQRFTPPVLIDEIQYAPELLPFIKMYVDKHKKSGLFWLTGSQQFHLMNRVSESLAGRVGIINLLGFSVRELFDEAKNSEPFLPTQAYMVRVQRKKQKLSLKDVYFLIWRGQFPHIALNKKVDRDLFYGSYVQTYLQRDMRDLAQVGDEQKFLRFLRATAARTAQLLNYADLARDADVTPVTAKKWMGILQASGLVYLLEPYHTNVTKRLVKTPKLYFLDTGLCTYLTEWSSSETLEAGAMSGAIFESWIFAELLKSYWYVGRRAPFYFYRDKDVREIDLLIIQDGVVYPVEFKKTMLPRKKDFRNFSTLNSLNLPIGTGGVLCLADELVPITEKYWCIPVGCI